MARHSQLNQKEQNRERYRTEPGGGKNRASGGRSAASAYVSPSTLPGEFTESEHLIPFQIDKVVRRQVSHIGTQPSLARTSSVANLVSQQSQTQGKNRIILIGLIFFIVGAAMSWIFLSLVAEENLFLSALQTVSETISQ